MKKLTVLFIISILIVSCKNESKKEIKKEVYPEQLGKVFKTHGGLTTWDKIKTLSFNKGEEIHTVDLHSRKTVINSPKYSLGFDGDNVWIDENEKGSYTGNPTFYYNLYFYFYAMPFVLADDGIIYEKVAPISYAGVIYPGYKISFNASIGNSPDDHYIVYYNSKTFKMEWLAYTVTFTSKKPNSKFHIIRYNKWENLSGLLLPKEITWYKMSEGGLPIEPEKSIIEFTLPLASHGKLPSSFFEKPLK